MKTFGRILIVVLAIGVGGYALQFLDFQIKGLLLNKGELLKNTLYLAGFYVHVAGGGIALIVGSFQFFPKLRTRNLFLHRMLGRIYVIACLLSGIAGLGIAFFADGGYITKVGFLLLAIMWLYTTSQAYLTIKQKKVAAHKEWMIRSYTMTFAAVLLRLQLPIYLGLMGMDFLDAYRIVSWSCWLPSLILIEWLIQRRANTSTQFFPSF